MRFLVALCSVCCVCGMAPVWADTLVAARTIPSKTIISAEDVFVVTNSATSSVMVPQDVVGLEARVVLYEGRPIKLSDVGPPALVERNQIVVTVFSNGGLRIATEGRALGRAAVGEPIRVMNIASRKIIMGIVASDGSVLVSPISSEVRQ